MALQQIMGPQQLGKPEKLHLKNYSTWVYQAMSHLEAQGSNMVGVVLGHIQRPITTQQTYSFFNTEGNRNVPFTQSPHSQALLLPSPNMPGRQIPPPSYFSPRTPTMSVQEQQLLERVVTLEKLLGDQERLMRSQESPDQPGDKREKGDKMKQTPLQVTSTSTETKLTAEQWDTINAGARNYFARSISTELLPILVTPYSLSSEIWVATQNYFQGYRTSPWELCQKLSNFKFVKGSMEAHLSSHFSLLNQL
jgi:hypothetical protein